MKGKKKLKIVGIIIIIIISLLVIGAIIATGKDGKKKDIQGDESKGSAETSITEGVEDKKDTQGDKSKGSTEVSITEQVLYDENDIKITATGIKDDSILGKCVELLIENSSDKNLFVRCEALIVNNYMITDLFSTSVAAGEKVNRLMYMSSNKLEAAGIENIGQIEVYFSICDDSSYKTLWDVPCITIKTSDFDKMDVSPQDIGFELYNEGGIRIVGKYVDEKSIWGKSVVMYIENNSGRNIGIHTDNLSVNGFTVTSIFTPIVYSGKMAIDNIAFSSSDLEANGITSIDDIELAFDIYDKDTYETIVESDTLSLKPKTAE